MGGDAAGDASSEAIARQIEAVRVGRVASVRGYPVRVDAPDRRVGQGARSSRAGDGACDLVWVERFFVR